MARDSQKNKGKKDRTIKINRNRKRRQSVDMDRCDACGTKVFANMLTPTFIGGKPASVCGYCL